MNTNILKDTIGWGFILWLIGYALGILLFTIVSPGMIGWIIMPIGIAITFWILTKKIKSMEFRRYLTIGIAWTVIAVICDYFFLVRAFKPADGYYKPDVYLYYIITLALPIFVGWNKGLKKKLI